MATETAIATGKPVEAELVVDDPNARVPQRINTPTQYRASIESWQRQSLNILSPATNFSGLPEGWAMVPAVVRLNPDPDAGDVYRDKLFCKADEVALTKVALSKIAQAAGMSIKTFRTDDRSVPNYWEMQASVRFFGLDGAIQELTATQEWDLREGAARSAGMSAAELKRSQLNGLRSCEARAINAAIRLFGIKQKYHVHEAAQPFMCVRVMYEPDRNDPEIRRMLAERALQGTSAMYVGGPVRAAVPELVGSIGVDLQEQTTGPTTETTAAAPAVQPAKVETADPNKPPVEGAVRIAEVTAKEGVNDKTKRPWKRFDVVDSNGEVCSTFDTKLADAANAARESKAWVELSIEQNGNYRNLVEISPAGQQPKLPNPEDL